MKGKAGVKKGKYMEINVKKEAARQYLKYFRIWFIITGVFVVLGVFFGISSLLFREEEVNPARQNTSAPKERVYDYADVMTDAEEQRLREYIAQKEPLIQADIVLVTIKEDVESGAYGWESAMMNYADDFYDQKLYGYDAVHGNGVLLLDNWYDGQAGSWLSTCGNVYYRFGDYEINRVLDAVYYGLDDGAYEAYKDYVDIVYYLMSEDSQMERVSLSPGMVLGLPFIVALIYALINLHQSKAKVTTQANTYVEGGRPVMRVRRDDFIRKHLVTRRIETSSGSRSGGSSRSGGGGSHRSSGGVSHGGGGRRR